MMVKKQTDKMKWEKILKAEDDIKSKMRNKADYTKLLREYPVEPIDNPLATAPSRRILTGTALDRILSRRGGIEAGSTVEMYGEFGTGKTQIAESIAAEAEGLKIYIDAEWTFRGDRFAEICIARDIDPKEAADRIRLYRPINWIHQEAVVKQLPEFDSDGKFLDIGVVIVDSIMKHWADSRDWQGRENLPQRQALLRAQISDLSNYCRRHNAVLFYTNQVYIAPVANPYASVENIYHSRGGASLEHIADYRILLRKGPRNLRFARLVDSPDLPLMEVPFVLHEKGISDIEDPGIRVQALERGEQYGLRFLDTKVSTRGAGKKYYAKAFLLGIMTEEEALENDYLNEKDIKELKEEKMEMKLERGEVKPPHEDDLTDEEKEALGEQKDDE